MEQIIKLLKENPSTLVLVLMFFKIGAINFIGLIVRLQWGKKKIKIKPFKMFTGIIFLSTLITCANSILELKLPILIFLTAIIGLGSPDIISDLIEQKSWEKVNIIKKIMEDLLKKDDDNKKDS